jgi:hypothetical protein
MTSSPSPFTNTGKLQVLPTPVSKLNIFKSNFIFHFSRQHYYLLNQ